MGKKVIFANFSRDERSADVRSAIDLLCKARIGTECTHTDVPASPSARAGTIPFFKLVFIDAGLMNSQLGLDWPKLLGMDERALINEGNLAEQFVAQELLANDQGRTAPELYYWLREGKSNNAEADYVVSHAGNIVPVEVKAGKSGTLEIPAPVRPAETTGHRGAVRPQSSLGTKRFRRRPALPLVSLPLYLAGKLPEILDAAL